MSVELRAELAWSPRRGRRWPSCAAAAGSGPRRRRTRAASPGPSTSSATTASAINSPGPMSNTPEILSPLVRRPGVTLGPVRSSSRHGVHREGDGVARAAGCGWPRSAPRCPATVLAVDGQDHVAGLAGRPCSAGPPVTSGGVPSGAAGGDARALTVVRRRPGWRR